MKIHFTLLLLSLTTMGKVCTSTTEEPARTSAQSAIQPAPPLIPGLKTIPLQSPKPTVTIPGNQTFIFDATAVEYAIFLIFNQVPTINGGVVTNLTSTCVAGSTNFLPGHNFNKTTVSFDTGLFSCTRDVNAPLHATQTKSISASGSKYYWTVLGYSKSFKLTHSGPIREFTF